MQKYSIKCRTAVFVAMAIAVLIPVPVAQADIPETATLSTERIDICQPGDVCANVLQAERTGSVEGELGITSFRTDPARSEQGFAVRFTNTFPVPGGTKNISFTSTWHIEGTATASGSESDGLCQVRQSAQFFTHVYELFAVDGDPTTLLPGPTVAVNRDFTFAETFTPQRSEFRRNITVFTELFCRVLGSEVSDVDLRLLEGTALQHLHLRFER